MTNKKSAQEKLCPLFESYMQNMEQDLKSLVMEPTQKRLKIIIMAAKNPLEKLLSIFELNTNGVNYYKIPQKLFNSYRAHVYSVVKNKCNKGVNFGRVKKEKDQSKIWGLFKGYWFHNAPKEMAMSLWTLLLKDIAKYFHNISNVYGSNNTRNWSESEIEKFLKLMFVKNIFEVKCQINSQSNPSGPVIQFAAWKIVCMQQVLNNYFDDTYYVKWSSWIKKKSNKGKKMRINSIVQQLVKPYAQKQFRNYCTSVGVNRQFDEFSINVAFIDEMNLVQYFRDEEEHGSDEKSQSDQSSNNMSVEESVGNESVAAVPVVTLSPNMNHYNGYHSAMSAHSNYRSHPYAHDNNDNSCKRLIHVKCDRCGKCKHHCKCDCEIPIIPSYEPIYNNHNNNNYYYPSYPSQYTLPSQYQPYALPPQYTYSNDINLAQMNQMNPYAPAINRNYNYNVYNDVNQINMEMDIDTSQNISNFQTVPNDFALYEIPNDILLPPTDRDLSSLIGYGNDENNEIF